MNWLITQDEVYGMCTGGASGLPAVEDLPVNETDMRWLELEARFGFCEKRNSPNFSDFLSQEKLMHIKTTQCGKISILG